MKPKINQLINKSVVQLKRGSPTVLDDGLEVYVIEMVWTPDTNWCDEEDFTME